MNEIATRLTEKIQDYAEDIGGFNEAELDELQILHVNSRASFPDRFNSVFDGFSYSGSQYANQTLMDRLLRILDVEASIPEELRLSAPPQVDDGLIPTFSLAKKDIARIEDLCSSMRKIIFATDAFDVPHRKRLLNRIAAIEAEIHKPKGLFDVIRGGIADLGETLGKFGTDIKPLTDRMQEVVKITRNATKEYDQLPAPDEVKQLPPPADET